MPIKTTVEAIREATAQLLESSSDYFVIGEGVPDPKACFGSTKDLHKDFPGRIFDMPVSENGMTGVCIGAALGGMRPIMVHMRIDFLLYAADQIINNAAKWHAIFGGQQSVPMVIRAVLGRGWGQGLQHSQRLEKMFASIPGLKVVCPSNAYDAKGLLIAAARDNNPVLYFDHRWIHEMKSEVPDEMYEIAIGEPKVLRDGVIPVTAWGYMVHEVMKAAEFLDKQGIEIQVIDSRGPIDGSAGLVIEELSMCPPSPGASRGFYPTPVSIMTEVGQRLGVPVDTTAAELYVNSKPHDTPNEDFRGPF